MQDSLWELVSFDQGGATLHGLLAKHPAPRGLVIHVHGTWGNFYGNRFVQAVAESALDEGWSFASVNVPGHDETAMDERIGEFEPAIREWLRLLNPTGLPVVLEGHSLGALKIIDLIRHEGITRELGVVALFLLSAFDCVGFYEREADLATARSLGLGDQSIVPDEVFAYWLLRWGALTRLAESGGEWDVFRTRKTEALTLLGSDGFPVPAYFAIGSEDFAAVPSVDAVVRAVETSGYFQDATVVPGAPHGFNDCEAPLAETVAQWLRSQGR